MHGRTDSLLEYMQSIVGSEVTSPKIAEKTECLVEERAVKIFDFCC